MQSCTECGTAITPAVGPPVLMNGKVVCQPCWQRLGADAAPTQPAAARPQSARMATSRRSVSSTAPASARRQTSTTPAARRSSSRAEAPSRSDRSSRSEEAASSPHRATSRTAALIEEVESSTTGDRMKLYIIIMMCVMVIAAAIAGFLWNSKRTRDAEEYARARTAADTAMEGIRGHLKRDPNDFAGLKKEIEEAKDKVKGAEFAKEKSELMSYESDVLSREQNAASAKANEELLQALEKEVQDPSKLPGVRVKIDSAKRAATTMGKEYEARVVKVQQALTLNTLREAFDQAKAKEAGGNVNDALAAYDDAVVKFNKEFDKGAVANDAPILNLFKEMLAESDKLVERVETPEFESGVAERDMLSAKERGPWGASAGAKFVPQGREMTLEGVPVEKGKVTGVVSMLPPKAAPWHDLVLDLEFTLLAGEMEMYVRYWPDKKSYRVRFAPSEGYELNKPYRMTIHVKGSQISLKQPDQPENRDRFDASTSRTGGIGFGLNNGSKAIISVCKLKVLRPKT